LPESVVVRQVSTRQIILGMPICHERLGESLLELAHRGRIAPRPREDQQKAPPPALGRWCGGGRALAGWPAGA